jgi:hypothetical protein
MTPASGLAITTPASRNVMRLTTVAPVFCTVAGFGLPAIVCASWLTRAATPVGAGPPVHRYR